MLLSYAGCNVDAKKEGNFLGMSWDDCFVERSASKLSQQLTRVLAVHCNIKPSF
jgi:hypothetical protein